MQLTEQRLKKLIQEAMNELLTERRVWGLGGAGMLACCSEDGTVFLQKRGAKVTGGGGQWAFPGGGIHPEGYSVKKDGVEKGHYETPIPPELQLPDDSERFIETAFDELEEEVGWMPSTYNIADSYLYDFEGFKYKTILIDVPLTEKQKYTKKDQEDEYSWESTDEGWYTWPQVQEMDLFFGFTPELLTKLQKIIG